MAKKGNTSPATKGDIAELRSLIESRFDKVEERLDGHNRQFNLLLDLLHSVHEDIATIKRDLRVVADKVLDNHEQRLRACERRLGLAA